MPVRRDRLRCPAASVPGLALQLELTGRRSTEPTVPAVSQVPPSRLQPPTPMLGSTPPGADMFENNFELPPTPPTSGLGPVIDPSSTAVPAEPRPTAPAPPSTTSSPWRPRFENPPASAAPWPEPGMLAFGQLAVLLVSDPTQRPAWRRGSDGRSTGSARGRARRVGSAASTIRAAVRPAKREAVISTPIRSIVAPVSEPAVRPWNVDVTNSTKLAKCVLRHTDFGMRALSS